MAKTYKGTLSLEWYNKQKSILLASDDSIHITSDIQASKVNWVNKEDALFYEIIDDEGKGLKPVWVNENDLRIKEARPLVIKESFIALEKDVPGTIPGTSTFFELKTDSTIVDSDNILIKGDNLLAINSLIKHFGNKNEDEKIKCIYIDPPYNTEQAFENYDDSLEHSQWLSMMRDRLRLLRKLLRNDGIIFIQIDQKELAYLKILCDEIFGRVNFLIQINWQRTSQRTVLGQGATPVINIVEYILVYLNNIDFKDEALWKIEKYFEADEKVFSQYNLLVESEGNRELIKEIDYKGDTIKFFRHSNPQLSSILPSHKNFSYYIKNIEFIARRDAQQKESSLEQFILSNIDNDGNLYSVERTLKQGKHKGTIKKTLYQNDNVIYYLKTYAKIENDKLYRKVDMNNMWLDSEISSAGIADEGGVQFKRNKKPEALIERILSMCTEEGDIILDSFAGSGTTLAVAHKMKRKWIGIEVGKHCDKYIVDRLKRVLIGEDQSGISKFEDVGWKGGGAFNYYHLGSSIISLDEHGLSDFNWSLSRKFLEESLLLSYDYTLNDSINFTSDQLFQSPESLPSIGIQKIGTKIRVAVVSLNEPNGHLHLMPYEEIMTICKAVRKAFSPEYINIFTNRGVEIAYDSKPDDLDIIKVPHAIFAALEQ